MKNFIFIIFIAIFLTSCSYKTLEYNYSTNVLSLPLSKDTSKQISFSNAKYENILNRCTDNSYTIKVDDEKYGKLFIESVSLTSGCSWRGLPSGFFTFEVRNQLKLEDFERVNRFREGNYHIVTYKFDYDSYVSVIDYFSNSGYTFILDNKGILTNELIGVLDSTYNYRFLDVKRANLDHSYSLTKNNWIRKYFDITDEPVIILKQ